MSFAPLSLRELAAYWNDQGGTVLGIVGDAGHTHGYHIGKDRIYDGSGPGSGANDYSVKLARDKAGLTNAAAAIDLGRLDGSLANLRTFSVWLVDQATRNRTAYRDVREIIYSPDGKTVWRFDGQDGRTRTGPGQGDDTHLTHTHISWYRDSENRLKIPLIAPYFEGGADVPVLSAYIPGQVATVKPTANVRTEPKLNATIIRVVSLAEGWVVTGWCKGDVDPDGGSDQWITRWNAGRWEYTAKSNLSSGPSAPATPAPAPDPRVAELEAALAKVEGNIKAVNVDLEDVSLELGQATATIAAAK